VKGEINPNSQSISSHTITYGTASAPFLAIRCHFELSKIYAESYPIASQVISSDFYVEDMLTGAIEELQVIRRQTRELLKFGGFYLANTGPSKTLTFDPSASISLYLGGLVSFFTTDKTQHFVRHSTVV